MHNIRVKEEAISEVVCLMTVLMQAPRGITKANMCIECATDVSQS